MQRCWTLSFTFPSGSSGPSLFVVSWRWGADPELALCRGLHPTQLQRAQRNQWERELQSEGQEGVPTQSHGAAPPAGKRKKTQKHICLWLYWLYFCHLLLLCSSLQASKWVEDGIYLLASQPVDKCQSHEGAELALQELERYLDNAGQNQLTDLCTIWTEYEAVLNQQFRVRKPACCGSKHHFAAFSSDDEAFSDIGVKKLSKLYGDPCWSKCKIQEMIQFTSNYKLSLTHLIAKHFHLFLTEELH